MEFSREDLGKLNKEMVAEISNISKYSLEEAESIWGGAPYYLSVLKMVSEGASINDMAKFILKKVKK